MSMLNIRRDKDKAADKLPRAANMPTPPAPEQQRQRIYDPAALNFAQRLIDDQAEIERLKVDVDQWRARALAAEEQMRQLELRLDLDRKTFDEHTTKTIDSHDREMAKHAAQRERDVERLTDERDFYKLRFARTVERLHVAGKVILDALSADTGEREVKPPPSINMTAMEEEISRVRNASEVADVRKSEDAQESHQAEAAGASQPGA